MMNSNLDFNVGVNLDTNAQDNIAGEGGDTGGKLF